MNTHRVGLRILALFALLMPCRSFAADTPDLGMPAPPLSVEAWAKGKPVTLAEGKGKNVYVIEFWATWCVPCIEGMPHLTALQKEFKDKGVTFIGVSDEDTSTVASFVADNEKIMGYTVAVDKGMDTGASYMGAFGETSIPHAFIVDREGQIVWHGLPANGLEEALTKVVKPDYKFDVEQYKKVQKARGLVQVYYYLTQKAHEPKIEGEIADKIFEYGESDRDVMGMLASAIMESADAPENIKMLALRAASKATQTEDGKDDPEIWRLYSQALRFNGNTAEAERAGQHEKMLREAAAAKAPAGDASSAGETTATVSMKAPAGNGGK